MKRYTPFVYALGLFLAVGLSALYFHERPIDVSRISFAAPCSSPLPYTVGTIDPRFKLTKEQVIAKLNASAALWNNAGNRTLLAYEPDNLHAMPVNFVYDERQQAVSLGQKIDTTEASQNAQRAELQAAQARYVAAQQAYATAIADFNTATEKYGEEVRASNEAGGADKETFARLEAERASLKKQQAALKQQGDTLEAQSHALKIKIDAFNAGVHQINQAVTNFNSTVGGDFEEGQYVQDATGKRHIDIYAYKSQGELLHSLAHEFGHALGLGHNENTASIMFPYNKSGVTLSDDDIADLKKACSLK